MPRLKRRVKELRTYLDIARESLGKRKFSHEADIAALVSMRKETLVQRAQRHMSMDGAEQFLAVLGDLEEDAVEETKIGMLTQAARAAPCNHIGKCKLRQLYDTNKEAQQRWVEAIEDADEDDVNMIEEIDGSAVNAIVEHETRWREAGNNFGKRVKWKLAD